MPPGVSMSIANWMGLPAANEASVSKYRPEALTSRVMPTASPRFTGNAARTRSSLLCSASPLSTVISLFPLYCAPPWLVPPVVTRRNALRSGPGLGQELVLMGESEQLEPVGDPQLFVDGGQVVAQGVLADVQLLGDRLGGAAGVGRRQADDLPLAYREGGDLLLRGIGRASARALA